jgi:hypothetical protein
VVREDGPVVLIGGRSVRGGKLVQGQVRAGGIDRKRVKIHGPLLPRTRV